MLLYTLITEDQSSRKFGTSILYQKVFRRVDQGILFLQIYHSELIKERQTVLPRKTNPVLLTTTKTRNDSNIQ